MKILLFGILLQAASNGDSYSGIIVLVVIIALLYLGMKIGKKRKNTQDNRANNGGTYEIKIENTKEVNQSNNIMNMNAEIKCPQCGGNRAQDLGMNKYKCMYCGTIFSPTTTQPQSNNTEYSSANTTPAQPSGQQIINVNVNGSSQQGSSNTGNDFARGAAGGAGLAVGGCLTGGLISILAPILGILFALYCVVSCVQSCADAL